MHQADKAQWLFVLHVNEVVWFKGQLMRVWIQASPVYPFIGEVLYTPRDFLEIVAN
jgi:hypothetical protein